MECSNTKPHGEDLANEVETQSIRLPFLSESRDGDASSVSQPATREENWSPYWRDLHILSFSFLFIFLAYGATQNLETSINTEGGLGSASLGVLYLSFTVSSLAASLIVIHLGSKSSLILGLSGYWFFIVANLYPSWYTMIPAALFLGFSASVLWVAQGTYLTCIAKNHAAACNVSEATALGAFNGEFFSMFSLHQVVGNLLALVLLQSGKEGDWTPQSSSTTKIFITFLGSMTIGAVLLCSLRPHSKIETFLASTNDDFAPGVHKQELTRASKIPVFDKTLLLLICIIFYSGMQQAFIWGDFTKEVITSTIGLSWVGGIMAAYGVADTLGSFVAGRTSSGLVSITIILVVGALCQILVLVGLFLRAKYGSLHISDLAFSFGAVVAWGLGDATFNTQICSVLGMFYPNNVEAAFGQNKLWQSAGTSVVFFISPYLSFTTKLALLFFSLLVSMGLFFVAMVQPARRRYLIV